MRNSSEVFELDLNHPNYERWRRAIDAAEQRGGFVVSVLSRVSTAVVWAVSVGESSLVEVLSAGAVGAVVLSRHRELAGARGLDLGCGVGGTSVALSRAGARVHALDRDPRRLHALRTRLARVPMVRAAAGELPFGNGIFDAVILQDVLEHVASPQDILGEIHRVLKPNGVMYLSTPNRGAALNIIADPHWGLPLAARLRRPALRRFLSIVRRADADRPDLAELF